MSALFDTLYINKNKYPEQKLATAVILCAIRDLSSLDDIVKTDAVNFLTAENSSWSLSRRFWCEIVPIDPELVRTKSLNMIQKGITHKMLK